jgi:hypothetical protein
MTSHQQRALERALTDALMKSLRPVMEDVVVAFRRELAAILTLVAENEFPRERRGQIGQTKCCSVCRLKGARNDAALPSSHTQEEHRRWKADWPAAAGRSASGAAPALLSRAAQRNIEPKHPVLVDERGVRDFAVQKRLHRPVGR